MCSYLLQNDLFPATQSAYRKDNSTGTALFRITNDIWQASDKDEDTILVLLDLSAAFDIIDHEVLLNKLNQRFGFRDFALNWLALYLVDRKQSVHIRSAVSVDSQLRFGVPQGSVLGPVLFSKSVAPVEDIVLSHGLFPLFCADDSQIYLTMGLSNRNVSNGKIEDCINPIIGWYSNNFLLCSSAKTKFIYFSSKFINNDPIPSINIGANTIKLEPAVCDLGVVLDKPLEMSRQVNNICKSAFLAIHNIGKVRNYLDQSTAEKIVHAFVTSQIDFCNSLLFGLPKKQLGKLQRVLNAAARITTRTKKYHHISSVLRKLHWLPVTKRIEFKILTMTYKALNGMAPSYICDLLQVHHPNRNLRSASRGLSLMVPASQTQAYGARSFSITAPTLWNSLPLDNKKTIIIIKLKKKAQNIFFLINFICTFIPLSYSLCIIFISYICKFISIFLLFYFLYIFF